MNQMTQGVQEPRVQCSWCKDWKPRTDFHKEKSKPLGVQSRCKFCKKLEKKEPTNQGDTHDQLRKSYDAL